MKEVIYVYCSNTVYLVNTPKQNKKLCLEIPGCVQHKVMYGVALRGDWSHHMDHRILLITMWKCCICQALPAIKSRTAHRYVTYDIGHSDQCGSRPDLVSLAQLQQYNPLREEPYP